MRRALLVLIGTGFLLTICNIMAEARTQYKAVIGQLTETTKAEKAVQMKVKAESCKYCHGKKSKKVRTEYGMKLHDALGGGDRKKYKFDKILWKRNADKTYSPKAIKLLRDAIKAAAKKK
ncbi:MAG: hypothetical protein HON53_00990 [Planctomycetaceae bacterium]|nr:hypothetical protein [Planctomycetaceae bacterium]